MAENTLIMRRAHVMILQPLMAWYSLKGFRLVARNVLMKLQQNIKRRKQEVRIHIPQVALGIHLPADKQRRS